MDDSEILDESCRDQGGVVQWASDGVLTVCAKPRDKYEDPTQLLFQAKDNIELDSDEKSSYVNYFKTVYPATTKAFWNQLTVDELRTLYENLEIWYNYPGHPAGKQETRAAFKPFYRIPPADNLQQRLNHIGFPSNTWVEVFHAGDLNTNFFIPSEFFSGTYYYPAKGSGVFLPMRKTLIAFNKVDALKKLKVTNDVIEKHAGPSFKKWLNMAVKRLLKENPNMSPDEAHKLALDNQIKNMAMGQNGKKLADKKICYYGLGSNGDNLLAAAAAQLGYNTIQLIKEAQLGCNENGVLVGFEIIDLKNPIASAESLRMRIPNSDEDDYISNPGPGFVRAKKVEQQGGNIKKTRYR